MNTRIIMHFRVLFASPTSQTAKTPPLIREARYTATKEVELLEIPERGKWIQDGPMSLQIYGMAPSLQGPRYICDADGGYSHGWDDMFDVPRYYCLESNVDWFTLCQRHGWEMRLQGSLGELNERYPDNTRKP